MKNKKIIIGSRGSKLALVYAERAKSELMNFSKILDFKNIEIKSITTTGDTIKETRLSDYGGKGLFSKTIEEELLDDKIDRFHFYTYLIKFGLGQTTYDAAQEIRMDKITREEGVALVKKYDSEFPKKYFKEFLEYVDLNEDKFWEILDSFRSPHLWGKNDKNEWVLKESIK